MGGRKDARRAKGKATFRSSRFRRLIACASRRQLDMWGKSVALERERGREVMTEKFPSSSLLHITTRPQQDPTISRSTSSILDNKKRRGNR